MTTQDWLGDIIWGEYVILFSYNQSNLIYCPKKNLVDKAVKQKEIGT